MSLLRSLLAANASSCLSDDEIEEFGEDPRDNATPEQLRQLQEDVNYQIAHEQYEEERAREHDRREFGHLVLVRDEEINVTGRITPGGTELDRDGWPVEPPVVTAIRVPTPVITSVFVPETPPRHPRVPVRRPDARLVNNLTAAEERIRELLSEKNELGKDNRDLRASLRRNAAKYRDNTDKNKRLVDDLLQENENLRKKLRIAEERDEFPLDVLYPPITSAEKGEDYGKDVIDLTGDNEESENE